MSRIILVLCLWLCSFSSFTQNETYKLPNALYSEWYYPFLLENKIVLSSYPFTDSVNHYEIDSVDLSNSQDYFFTVYKDRKVGVINSFGTEVVPISFDSIRLFGAAILGFQGNKQTLFYVNRTVLLEADSIFPSDKYFYIYKSGKVGIESRFTSIPPKYKALHPLTLSVSFDLNNSIGKKESKDYFVAIQENGFFQLIDEKGEEKLPPNVTELQEMDFGIMRFFDYRWKYYIPKFDKIVDSEGDDVIFYSASCYKKYNSTRTKSTIFYLDLNRSFSGVYDDYFPLNGTEMAVKLDSSIGVIDLNTSKIILPLKYQQVNLINYDKGFYRIYKNDLCGLADKSGDEVVPIMHHNVLTSTNPDLFYVFFNNQKGLVKTGGAQILPPVYDDLQVGGEDYVILKKGRNYGLASINGKILSVPKYTYKEHHYLNTNSYIVFYNDPSSKYIYSKNGLFSQNMFEHVEFGNSSIKGYLPNGDVIVYVVAEDGKIEDQFQYTGISSYVINEKDKPLATGLTDRTTDELEENQLAGKFGKRFYAKKGMSVPPTYTVLREDVFHVFFGEVEIDKAEYPINDEFTLSASRAYTDILSPKSYNYLMNERFGNDAMRSSRLALTINPRNSKLNSPDFLSKSNELTGLNLVYSSSISSAVRKYYFASSIETCPIENADVSIADYFTWLNNLGVFTTSPSNFIKIYNPKIGLKFVDSKVLVLEERDGTKHSRETYYHQPVFKKFDYNKTFEFLLYQNLTKKSSDIKLFNHHRDSSSIEINNVLSYHNDLYAGFLSVEHAEPKQVKIHLDFPDFEFIENHINVGYHAGLLIQKVDSANYRLATPKNRVISDCLEDVQYLGNGIFRLLEIGESAYTVYNHNEKIITFKNVESIDYIQPHFFIVKLKDSLSYTIYNIDFQQLFLSKGRLHYIGDSRFWINRAKGIQVDLLTNVIDTLLTSEELKSSGFILGKDPNKYVRRFGHSNRVYINYDDVIEFKNTLIVSAGKRNFSVDKDLTISRLKGGDNYEKLNENLLLTRSKKKTIITKNLNDEPVYTTNDPDVKFGKIHDVFQFYDNDELLYCSKEGLITKDKFSAINHNFISKSYQLTANEDKVGLISANKIELLPSKYTSVEGLENNEVIATLPSYKKLYSLGLKDLNFAFTGTIKSLSAGLLIHEHNGYMMLMDDNFFPIFYESEFYYLEDSNQYFPVEIEDLE